MVTTLCADSGPVLRKAGEGIPTFFTTDSADGSEIDELINQAESYINVKTLINWVDIYGTLDDDTKKILEDACSARAARSVIGYELSSYFSIEEAQTLLDVNETILDECIDELKQLDQSQFVKGE